MKLLFTLMAALFISSRASGQCVTQKKGSLYGFFRVTNFKQKVCWLSEPFAYNTEDRKMVNYELIKQCFKDKVVTLGGNVDVDLDEFGGNKVVWLDNFYDPNDTQVSSSNFGLPSPNDCIKWMKDEIHYKTGVGMKVKIVRMYTAGLVDPSTL